MFSLIWQKYFVSHICQKSVSIYVWIYFWLLCSLPWTRLPVFTPRTHCFDYYSFMISLEIKCISYPKGSLFLFFIKVVWIILGLLHFHMNFRVSLPISFLVKAFFCLVYFEALLKVCKQCDCYMPWKNWPLVVMKNTFFLRGVVFAPSSAFPDINIAALVFLFFFNSC